MKISCDSYNILSEWISIFSILLKVIASVDKDLAKSQLS